MTTPHQGPGMWQQGNAFEALEWLANLDARQQQALQRAMNTHQALGPIYNAAARVQQVSVDTARRLSDGAQTLATQARQFGRDTVTRAGEIRDNTVDRVADFGQRVQVQADLATQVVNERLDAAGRAITAQGRAAVEGAQNLGRNAVEGAQTAGRNAVQAGRNAVEGAQNLGRNAVDGAQTAGRNAVQAGRNTVDRMSRWVQDRRSNASNRANAARAAFAAFKNPALNQANVHGKDIQALSAHAHALVSAQTPEARAAAAQQLVQAASSLQTSGYQYAQQAPGQHRAGADRQGNLAQFVNAGQPSAGQIPARAAAQETNAQGQQQGTQGEAQRTGGPTSGPAAGQKGPEFNK
ncbi:hypothetical protein [Kribbella sp. NBC_00359]|uniref:hypothetical protein n=1 Tax=Kribbella sp. NBC_00359 TaxID=2975966 RepID=UPI002E2058BA